MSLYPTDTLLYFIISPRSVWGATATFSFYCKLTQRVIDFDHKSHFGAGHVMTFHMSAADGGSTYGVPPGRPILADCFAV